MADNPNPSLQKKSAARTAAVQCLYRLALTGETLSATSQVELLKKQLANNREEQKLRAGIAMEPNYTFLTQLLEGIAEFEDKIDERLDSTLSANWTRKRMSPLLIAVLQCGVFELFFFKDAKPAIVIDEYTRIARSFFAEAEVDFVHGALSGLSKKFHG